MNLKDIVYAQEDFYRNHEPRAMFVNILTPEAALNYTDNENLAESNREFVRQKVKECADRN